MTLMLGVQKNGLCRQAETLLSLYEEHDK